MAAVGDDQLRAKSRPQRLPRHLWDPSAALTISRVLAMQRVACAYADIGDASWARAMIIAIKRFASLPLYPFNRRVVRAGLEQCEGVQNRHRRHVKPPVPRNMPIEGAPTLAGRVDRSWSRSSEAIAIGDEEVERDREAVMQV